VRTAHATGRAAPAMTAPPAWWTNVGSEGSHAASAEGAWRQMAASPKAAAMNDRFIGA
jgi:hypothetical protein